MHSPPPPPRSGRSRRNRTLTFLTVTCLVTPLLAGAVSPDATPASAPAPHDTPAVEPTNAPPAQAPLELDEPATVTLITGDQVTVHPGGLVETEPGPGREHITFDNQNSGNVIRVVPSDAAQLLAQGKLDERLFNLTYLIREGYDDTSRPDLPLIIEGTPKPVRQITASTGAEVERQSGALNISTVTQKKRSDKGQLWDRMTSGDDGQVSLPAGVDKIWLDGIAHVTLDESVPQISAPQVWDSGYTGEGVTVAVLDTGIDTTHPDLAGQVTGAKAFSETPGAGMFAVNDDVIGYAHLGEAQAVLQQGSSDPLVYVGRACVDSEGDDLLADPQGATALVARSQDVCEFAEKFDAVVDAGATGVVIFNDEPGLFRGRLEGAELGGSAWGATISDSDGAKLLEMLQRDEQVVLGFTDEPLQNDLHGHGTHVASTVSGTGVASDGARKGVAPDAKLLSGKVCDESGDCQFSWMIAGMEWAVENGADVVNMSVSGAPTDGTDPVSQAVNTLTETHDVLFVIAAGNSGSRGPSFVGNPGTADAALTVGAVDKNDQLAGFSSRGPRLGDYAVKPEITAPGVDIVAARAVGTSLGTPVNDLYTSVDGTSMATPHVAGSAALLAQARPGLDARALKRALASTTIDGGNLWFEQGTGRIDVSRAVVQGVYADGSVNFGAVRGSDGPLHRQVTYRNHTDQVVILVLDSSLTDLLGRPVGALDLSRTRLAVAPGREASVTASVDPRTLNLGAGVHGGVITATGRGRWSDISLRTAVGFGIMREVVPLGDDWDEAWATTHRFANMAPTLKGATLGPDGDQLFLSGATLAQDPTWITMAVDATSGEEIWRDELSVGSMSPDLTWSAVVVSPDGSKVYVSQDLWDPERSERNIVTIAYNNTPPQQPADPQLGEKLWQASYPVGLSRYLGRPVGGERIAVSPDGSTVLLVGTVAGENAGDFQSVTLAYDAVTGAEEWVALHGHPGLRHFGVDLAVSPTGNLAYMTGFEQQGPGLIGVSPVTIAYEMAGDSKGEQRWIARHKSTTGNYQSWHNSISQDGTKIFVSTTSDNHTSDDPYDGRMETTAYDAATGQHLWTSQFGAVDHGFFPGQTQPERHWDGAIAVSPNNDLLYVTGMHCEGGQCTGAYAFVTVAYDQTTGEERWFQIHESPGIPGRFTFTPHGVTSATSPDGSQVYVTGSCCWSTADGPENSDQTTIAYDATTGKLLATARHQYEKGRNLGYQVLASPDENTIYTVAEVHPQGGRKYWSISAYRPPMPLTAAIYRSRGKWFADLTWSGATTDQIDIHRNGRLITTVDNTGTYTDELGNARQGQELEYMVCAAGTNHCSNKVNTHLGDRPSQRVLLETN